MKKIITKSYILFFLFIVFSDTTKAQISGSNLVCPGFEGATTYTCTASASNYSWSISPAGPSVSFSTVDSARVHFFTAGNYTLTVNTTSPSNTYTLAITVKPQPTVNSMAIQNICSGDTSAQLIFTTNPPSLLTYWNCYTPQIGLPFSGTGDINNYPVPVLNGGSAETGGVQVHTFLNGCRSDTVSINVRVVPHVSVNPVASQTVCNGVMSSPIAITTNSSFSPGWINSTPSIGLAASGFGNIPSFTPTGGPITTTITATSSPYGCAGDTQVFTITVNPPSTISAVSNQTVCSGDTLTAINFVTSPVGLPVTWTNSNTLIGLPASGNGDIAEYITPIINGGPIQLGNVTVTTGCTPTSFSISVVPNVSINPVLNQTVCPSSNSSIIAISTNSISYAVDWSNSNTSIGLPSSGSGNIPSFFVGGVATTATITAIVAPNGCPGDTTQFAISNIIDSINVLSSDDTICNGASVVLTAPVLPFSSYTNSTDYSIPDNNLTGITSNIIVNGYSSNVEAAQIYVKVNLTHEYDVDLGIYLKSPNGTIIDLSTNNGGLGDNYVNTIFSSSGPSITTGIPPFTGIYTPEQSFTFLNSSSTNGTWSLIVNDNYPGDVGILLDWTLTITYSKDYNWQSNSSLSTSVGDTIAAFPSTPGGYYTVNLPISGGCVRTGTVSVVVNQYNMPTPIVQDLSYCLNDSAGSLSAYAYNGGTLYWYSTYYGGTSNLTAPIPLTLAVGTTTYYVSESAPCGESGRSGLNVTVNPNKNIFFNLNDVNNNSVTSGTGYLLAPSQTHNYYDTISVSNNFSLGNIVFTSIPHGNYIMKFVPDSTIYPQLISLYYNISQEAPQWNLATMFIHSCVLDFYSYIYLPVESSLTGPGFISGTVVEGVGFGNRLSAGYNNIQAIGDPLKNVNVNLVETISNLVVAQSTTDINGYYEFTNVAVGDYTLQVDIPGLIMDSSYSIQITPILAMSGGVNSIMSTSYTNLNFIADDNSIYPVNTIGLTEISGSTKTISLYPNPSSEKIFILNAKEILTEQSEYSVFNALGEEVLKGALDSGNSNILISSLSSGVYFLKIKTLVGDYQGRIVVQK